MSSATSVAGASVAARRHEATALGLRLAELTEEPEAFVIALVEGLAGLSDPEHAATGKPVETGTQTDVVVRAALVRATQSPLRRALRDSSPAAALSLAQRLGLSGQREVRIFALPCLERSLDDDPERTWQLLRRLGRMAADRIEVDAMAGLWAAGVLAESFRWAELEQLVYSQRTAERCIVGASLAHMPRTVPAAHRTALVSEFGERAYLLIQSLIGDAAPMVQKSLSRAVREWARIDSSGTEALLRDETAIAVERTDGHRARVVRDALSSQPTEVEADMRARLSHVRRNARAPSTSVAAVAAADLAVVLTATDGAVAHQGDRYARSHA